MRLLLIDTCGEMGSIALAEGEAIVSAVELPARAASSALIPAIGHALQEANWTIKDVEAVGVVSGPGSFTGVRVGLAAAKGLCEARSLPMAAVSRLHVLGHAAGLVNGFAMLDAGRGELYVRHFGAENETPETLATYDDLLARAAGARVIVAEERLLTFLQVLRPELYRLSASDALPLALRTLAENAHEAEPADANYVRSEQQIYRKASAAGQGVLT